MEGLMDSLFSLAGKTVLITGASSGLGEHFSTVLATAGADLVLAARRTEKLDAVAARARGLGRQVSVVQMDVADHGSIESAFADMPAIDVVVNNAGMNVVGALDVLSESDWDAVVDTNLKGVWMVSKFAVQRWRAAKQGGNIINIASVLGLRVSGHIPAYVASKAAVVQLTKAVALDYARDDIRCNAICPGYFLTDINRDYMQSPLGEKMIKRIPYKRIGNLDELNGPLLLLASDASSYMSGSVLAVDGAHLCSTL
jgi:NAD(P)-dependent dehydrogenase (short-subunit alcohol dehydrogenase family)